MKDNDRTEINIIDLFKTAPLESNHYILITQFPADHFPRIGDFLTFANKDVWQISGIVTAAVDQQGKEIMAERQSENLWDIAIQPVSAVNELPQKGTAVITSKLPEAVINNGN